MIGSCCRSKNGGWGRAWPSETLNARTLCGQAMPRWCPPGHRLAASLFRASTSNWPSSAPATAPLNPEP